MPHRQTEFIRQVFSEVPPTYELVNHVLTFGLDILWRRKAVKTAIKAGGGRWADMCSGTGETAMYLRRWAPNGTSIYAVDSSLEMLYHARKKPESVGITFVSSDIEALPFPDSTFDVITMSFAARNINLDRETIIRRFAEYRRVLKPGGLFVNLETSRPLLEPFRMIMDLYVRLFVKMTGAALSGTKAGYAYLAHSIPRFYPAEELAAILREAGFSDVTYRHLMFGAAAIHESYN